MKKNNIQKMPEAGQAGNGTKPHVAGSAGNTYRCPRCKGLFKRNDERQWIKSYCTATDGETRLIIQK